MILFDQKERNDDRPAFHVDNTYDFYDRSSLPQIEQIRNTLNQWFTNFPESERKDLKLRLQKEFSAAFFELFLHELFKREGFTLEPHPNVPGTNKKPDFLVKGNGLEFYLEAKESTDKTESERSLDNRIHQLYDLLNQTDSPNFFLLIKELVLKSQNQPSAKAIKLHLENELKRYDPDLITMKIESIGFDGTDTITYEDDDVRLAVSLISKSPQLRGNEDVRPIGMYPFQSFWGGSDESIKTAIKKKATRYGVLNKPYLICINATSEKGLDYYDMMNALFGSLQLTFSTSTENRREHWTRALDGVFLNSYGPNFTRVSAIYITHVNTANLHIANHWLVKHPFASKDLSFDPFRFQKTIVIHNKIETIKGISIKEILEIPDNWMNFEF
jgi:hypothetical protein